MNAVTHLRFMDGYRPIARPKTPESRLGQLPGEPSIVFDTVVPAVSSPTSYTPSGGSDVSTWDAMMCSLGWCSSEIADINSGPQSVVDNCTAMYGVDSPACLAAQGLAATFATQTPSMVTALTSSSSPGFTLPTWAWAAIAIGAALAIQKL